MGTRGPLPNPRSRRGQKRQKRATSPATTLSRPTIPRDLTGEARAEWRRVVKYLDEVGAISVVDRAILIRYCRAWAEWLDLDELVKQTGRLVPGRVAGTQVRNPAALLRREAETTLLELSRELALSPSARLRIGIEHQREQEQEAEGDGGVADFEQYREQLRG